MTGVKFKVGRRALALGLAVAPVVALLSLPGVRAGEVKGRDVSFTAHVPAFVATVPTLLTVTVDGRETTVGGGAVNVTEGGTLTLNLTTTTGTINVTRDTTAACPAGESGAVILVNGAIANVGGTATFTPAGDFFGLRALSRTFSVPNQARQVKVTLCAAIA